MELEKIGVLPVDRNKLTQTFGELPPGTSAAIHDISIASSFNRTLPAKTKQKQTISRIGEILAPRT
jgi:hypothetical protein